MRVPGASAQTAFWDTIREDDRDGVPVRLSWTVSAGCFVPVVGASLVVPRLAGVLWPEGTVAEMLGRISVSGPAIRDLLDGIDPGNGLFHPVDTALALMDAVFSGKASVPAGLSWLVSGKKLRFEILFEPLKDRVVIAYKNGNDALAVDAMDSASMRVLDISGELSGFSETYLAAPSSSSRGTLRRL